MDGAPKNVEQRSIDDLPVGRSIKRLFGLSQHGLVWVDTKLTVISCNPVAETMLMRADGIRLRGKRLAFQRAEIAREIEGHLSIGKSHLDAQDFGRSEAPILMRKLERPSGCAPYFVAAIRFRAGEGPPGGMLLIEDLSAHPTLHPEVCKTIYGLTPAETRVAMRHIEGRSAPGIAQDLGLSALTVRTHIKHVFKKVGVRSQLQLMAALCRLAFLPVGTPAAEPLKSRVPTDVSLAVLGAAPADIRRRREITEQT